MAYIRYKGPYAYLVYTERFGEGSKVRQKVLYYFGREVMITDEIIAEVEAKFPDIEVDGAGCRLIPDAFPAGRRRAATGWSGIEQDIIKTIYRI